MDDYKSAIDEAVRVLEQEGKLVVMVLNPESEYFKAHYSKEGSYFRRIKHKNPGELADYVVQRFTAKTHYFLGIKGERIFDTQDKRYASLFIISGIKRLLINK
jgi:ubiquinone/menaquinone biosynthesis C-methylase UbiE